MLATPGAEHPQADTGHDRDGPPAEIWDKAAGLVDEKQLTLLFLWVAMTNLFNRLNATTKKCVGAAGEGRTKEVAVAPSYGSA